MTEGRMLNFVFQSTVLDEAFPEITIDLVYFFIRVAAIRNLKTKISQVFVQASFTPAIIASLAHKLHIPRSLMFVSSPGPESNIFLEEFGTRIISL